MPLERRLAILRRAAGRADVVLVVLGVLGFALWAWAAPRHLPTATAELATGREQAGAAARTFVESKGYAADDYVVQTDLAYQSDLSVGLQRSLGRPAAVAALREEEVQARLPVYHWDVNLMAPEPPSEAGSFEIDSKAETVLEVRMTIRGEVWELERHEGAPAPGLDRDALGTLMHDEAAFSQQEAFPDSLLSGLLVFEQDEAIWQEWEPAAMASSPLAERLRRAQELPDTTGLAALNGVGAVRIEQRVQLRPEDAVVLARHHLVGTALERLPLAPDSAWVPRLTAEGAPAARVRFRSQEAVEGQHVTAEVEVTATGALLAVQTRFNEDREPLALHEDGPRPSIYYDEGEEEEDEESEAGISVGSSSDDDSVAGAVEGVTYALVFLVLLVVFFRRLSGRLLDVSAALRDATWGGLFAGVSVAAVVGYELAAHATPVWAGYGMALLAVGASVVLSGLLVFVISAPADALAREAWSDRTETFNLLRRLHLRNVPTALALARGLGVAGVVLGLVSGALLVAPRAVLADDGPATVLAVNTLSAVLAALGGAGYKVLLVTLAFLLAPTAWVCRKGWPVAVAVGLALILLTAVRVAPLSFASFVVSWPASAAVAAALLAAFWRYDLLVAFMGLFVAAFLIAVTPLLLADGVPLGVLDAFLLAFLPVTYVASVGSGLFSGRDSTDVPTYVPDYVEELTRQQRMQRELEIAHQVQASFLPRRMPKTPGADLAASCLPAYEVGGDYYDVVEVAPGRLALVIGDVSGKGFQAAFFMTLAKGFWQTLCRQGASPAKVLREMNVLFGQNAPAGTFVSMIAAVLDVEARTFTFARAGHCPLLLRRSGQQAELLRPPGLALGLTGADRFVVEEQTVRLHPGDTLVLYTDGFSEAVSLSGEEYTDERLAQRLTAADARTAHDVLRLLSNDVDRFAEGAGRHDDMTMLVVRLAVREERTSVRA